MADLRGHATALVGAQYGSEGKGLVAAKLANLYDCHVRTGGPNAGHTFYYNGQKCVARSVPCGWINPDARLYIGPGAVLDLGVLAQELDEIASVLGEEPMPHLMVDHRATVISMSQHTGEGGVEGKAHKAIGSTGEGVGLARMSRVNRGALIPTDRAPYAFVSAQDRAAILGDLEVEVGDVAAELHRQLQEGAEILLEGTQGSGLSLTLGPWPYCTSTDTNAAQLAADAGISPSDVRETVLVARTYPIRVAGNSGPLAGEISWTDIGQEPEITTVTKKVRRIGTFDLDQVRYAAQVNWPCLLVITFMDYLWPETAGVTDQADFPEEALEWLEWVAAATGCEVMAVGTGPDSLAYPVRVGVVS